LGGLLDDERGGDLAVGEALGDSLRTSRSRGVSSSRRVGRLADHKLAAMQSITRLVTEGERSASLAATVWIAAVNSSVEV
jgi:hypothetical protein